jgi:pyruvate ferredoxin oxidoreductase beta subunit
MELGRMAVECGLWPCYEMIDGQLSSVKKIKRVPVDEYLKAQKRFRHLFKPIRNDAEISKIQAIADANASKYGFDIE